MEFLPAAALLSFVLTCVIIELTPGPNMTYLALLSSLKGKRAGFSMVAGVATGLFLIGCIVLIGAGAVIAKSPMLYEILRYAGAAYLLWLAFDAWRGSDAPAVKDEAFSARYFTRGLMTNLLNPKAAIFYMTIFPSFVPLGEGAAPYYTVMTALYVAVATIIHALIVLLGAQFQPFLSDPRKARMTGRFFAVLLVFIAAWFLWSMRV